MDQRWNPRPKPDRVEWLERRIEFEDYAEGPLLEDRIEAVPKRQGETKPALGITDPQQSVLAPAVDP